MLSEVLRGLPAVAPGPHSPQSPHSLHRPTPGVSAARAEICNSFNKAGLEAERLCALSCWETKAAGVPTTVAKAISRLEEPREGDWRACCLVLPRPQARLLGTVPREARQNLQIVAKPEKHPPCPCQAGNWPQARADPSLWELWSHVCLTIPQCGAASPC